jgi:DNA-binding transcriptional LysR family regulator
MDRLQSMRVFQQVVDEGSFAAAARTLDLSAAVVTRLVGDLEQHLGARLLQRTTRRLALTDAGQAYLSRVRHILTDIDEAHAVAQAHTRELAGVLRVLAPPVVAVHILAPVVAEFRRLHPRILLDIEVDSPAEPPIEDFDITLMGAEAGFNANVIARPIVSIEGVVCASPPYLSRHGTPQQPADLSRHLCLRLSGPGRRPRHWRLINPLEADRVIEVDVEPALLVNHTDTLLRATLEGAGLSSQPMDLVALHLKSGTLQRVLAPWITGRFTLYAALPSRKFMPARTRVFLEFLTERTRATMADAQHAVPSASMAPT